MIFTEVIRLRKVMHMAAFKVALRLTKKTKYKKFKISRIKKKKWWPAMS